MPKSCRPRKKLSEAQRRDLDIEIGFMEALVRRDPTYVEALQILGDDYTRRGRFREGLRVDEQLVQLCPRDALARYNLACSYALVGRSDEAVAALREALDLGYRDFKWLRRDPDLKTIRRHPGYRALLVRIRRSEIRVH